MAMFEVLADSPKLFVIVSMLLGLIVGSFLNVVAYRLPNMLERQWRTDCHKFLGLTAPPESGETWSLVFPGSCCPHCHTPIKPWHNVPVISYFWLNGRCATCQQPIPWRYPLVEALAGILAGIVAWRFGFGEKALFAMLITWALLVLSLIDIDRQLLLDVLTVPLLWAGLLLSVFEVFTLPRTSIIGAVAGYMSLWLVYHGFKLLTRKEGMGHGDFKLLAALGAWLGWSYLPQIILLSSLLGAVIGTLQLAMSGQERSTPIPFGPYLAAAGWVALLWGDTINRFYLAVSGL